MSTYTCPHCGERGLSTQRRHWCPKAPPISQLLRLGPPRSRDPIANEYIAHLTRELEAEREQVRALRAYVAAEIEHTVHRVTCETCIVGGECDEEQDLWEKMDQARNLAWELVRPGVTKLRVDAITGALIEAPTSTERER